MGKIQKLTQRQLAQGLQLLESDVSKYVADNEPKADDSGHWVFFSPDTPKVILDRLKVGRDLRLGLKAPD